MTTLFVALAAYLFGKFQTPIVEWIKAKLAKKEE